MPCKVQFRFVRQCLSLIIGLIIATLLGFHLRMCHWSTVVSGGKLGFSYLGLVLGMKRKDELLTVFQFSRFGGRIEKTNPKTEVAPIRF